MEEIDQCIKTQQKLMQELRNFIDQLRDIKKKEETYSEVRKAIDRLCSIKDANCTIDRVIENGWKNGLVPRLQELCNCIQKIDAYELHQESLHLKKTIKKSAPLGLLSLRDYSVLQGVLEVIVCWGAYVCIKNGILLPIEKRRPTKTLQITREVLSIGTECKVTRSLTDLVLICETIVQILLLPQFQPILLPKYLSELFAVLIYGEITTTKADIKSKYHGMRSSLMQVLPLKLKMISLRAALGQAKSSPATAKFKEYCGRLLSEMLLENGGAQTTIEMLLGAVDEGNTQARMQVATLISQCPSHLNTATYLSVICPQVKALFFATSGNPKLLVETAVLILDQLLVKYKKDMDKAFLSDFLQPLLAYEDSSTFLDTGDIIIEKQLDDLVIILKTVLSGPPPSPEFVRALVPVFRPLIHMYAFALGSKSRLTVDLREILLSLIRLSPFSASLLQMSILSMNPPLRETLVSAGYTNRSQSHRTTNKFCAGGSGGISIRAKQETSPEDDNQASLIEALVELLGSKELESCDVVGDLFASLLLTYTNARKGGVKSHNEGFNDNLSDKERMIYEKAKTPKCISDLEQLMALLLALIEQVGPAVLRSAEIILQCIATVLETYAQSKREDVPSILQSETNVDEEDSEMIKICLGMLITILELGSDRRCVSEEVVFRKMLNTLEILSSHDKPEVAEVAAEARARILCRGTDPKYSQNKKQQHEKTFEEALKDAEEDLNSTSVPMRARGIVTLTKLVRRMAFTPSWNEHVHTLLQIYMAHLEDKESYVFLAAIQGLSSLADFSPLVAIPLLVESLRNKILSIEKRIKLSEALLFTARRCGEVLPKYAHSFVYAYLECIRPPSELTQQAKISPEPLIQVIQEVSLDENSLPKNINGDEARATPLVPTYALPEATLRASCLSNLAEVCGMLKWSVHPFITDVVTCVFGILQLELKPTPENNAVRRGAIFVLKYMIQLMGSSILQVMPDQMKSIYNLLKHVGRTDSDEVVRYHASQALIDLGNIMKSQIFLNNDECLHPLRIIR